jgi:hypothetical protein
VRRPALIALCALLLLPAAPARAAQYADTAARELASPALAAPQAGVLEVYTRPSGGALQRRVQDAAGRWSTAQVLGGTITSKPAAVSMTAGRTDVFARGGEGQLVHRYAVDGRWGPWAHLGGRITGAPTVVSWASGRLDVFARGLDGSLQHKWFAAGRWFAWERLGGSLASAPAAVAMAPGRLDVFARGTDGSLQHLYYPGGLWSRWSSLGGILHSEPAAVSTRDGAVDVFVRGGDGDLRQKSWVRGSGWSGWSRLVGAVTSGPGVVVTATGDVVLSARGSGGRYLARTRPAGGTWTGWTDLDGLTALRGLGAWVDLYDYASLDREAALDDLRARGMRTVYLQTSRFSAAFDVAPEVAGWVDAAHARGLRAVGWYLPGYGDMARGLRRTLAVADLVTPAGGHLDAVGVDIEAHTGIGSSNEVSRPTMHSRAVEHLRAVRARTFAPLAAITPQPTATDGAGETWEGFPWAAVGATSDLVLPMSYWPRTCRDACVRDYTATNARYAGSWSGKPVHIAGRGYPSADGTQVSDSDIRAFVDGADAAGVLGGGVYDYASTRTRTAWWSSLSRLNG